MSLAIYGSSKSGYGSEDDTAVKREYVRQGNINLPEVIGDGSLSKAPAFAKLIYVIKYIYTSMKT